MCYFLLLIIQALARINAEFAAQRRARLNAVEVRRAVQPDVPIKQDAVEAPAKSSVVAEVKELAEDDKMTEKSKTPYSSIPPFKKGQQQRIAHVPKTEKISPSIPTISKIQSSMKRGSCSPPDNTIPTKRTNQINLDFLLTPPSSTVSPNDTDEPENYAATLIADIVTWDASNIMNKTLQNKRHVSWVPTGKFEDYTHYERFVCMFFSPVHIDTTKKKTILFHSIFFFGI